MEIDTRDRKLGYMVMDLPMMSNRDCIFDAKYEQEGDNSLLILVNSLKEHPVYQDKKGCIRCDMNSAGLIQRVQGSRDYRMVCVECVDYKGCKNY